MALFNRANLNTISLLNCCYCKFMTGTMRFKMNKRNLVSSSFAQEKFNKLNAVKRIETTKVKTSMFETEIANRRNQACRSILVQVYSSNSYNDLQNYCAQFGKILSMHYYWIDKQQNYILIEFKDAIAVNDIISHASFMNSDLIAPVRSSVLWFRKGQNTGVRNNHRKIPLSMENICTYPNEKQITNILCNAKSISGQIIDLYDILKLNELEIRLKFHTAYHLEQYFSGLFRNIKVLPFGSSINGFGRKKCDLDLVLVFDDTEEQNRASRLIFHAKPMKINERRETKEFMGILASTMQHFIPGICNVRKILEARVPIIKFDYEYTQFECDLSTTNMTAIYMSELLNLYGEIDWRVRPLVIAIRKWAKSQNITSDVPGPWITNFSLSLLVIFYLQQKNILPSLKILKSYATRDDIRYTEKNIDCTFLRDVQRLPAEYKYKSNQDTLETLLHGFLEYYSSFDFYTKGICIREGIPIRKQSRSTIHIVNPLETTLNVSKNVNIHELNRMTAKMHDAIFILETGNKSRDGIWGLMTLLRMKDDIIDMPKLNSIEEHSVEDQSKNSHKISHDVIEVSINNSEQKEEIV